MPRLRVLVVEDSLTVRKRLCEVLSSDPEIDVIAEAVDGKRAIELCRELRPDVMTLDMMLPVMSGLAATEYIMAHCPTPILIVSASVNRGELFRTFDALEAGAVDVLDKPRGDEVDGDWERRLLAAVKMVARIKVITHPRARLGSWGRAPAVAELDLAVPGSSPYQVVALGASTGGPAALVEILRGLPASLPVPLLIVLHIDELFGVAFVDWLDSQTSHRVARVRDQDTLASWRGRVGLAPPGAHLALEGGRLRLKSDPPRHSCRPSIDVLFESLARDLGPAVIACVLTGMGRDGAAGLLDIRRAGGFTLTQDEATSVVYGMPREAELLGASRRVLPLGEIGPTIAGMLGVPQRMQR